MLSGLKDKLMDPELVRTFIEEFQAEANRLHAEQQAEITAKRSRLQALGEASVVVAILDRRQDPGDLALNRLQAGSRLLLRAGRRSL